MRTVNELTPDERKAYQVWQSKLKDRTLSAAQHDECRREIDNLLWQGPNQQVMRLRSELNEIRDRIQRVEFHLGLDDDLVTSPSAASPSAASPSAASPSDETRGRPQKRFIPQKVKGGWGIHDRESDCVFEITTFKARKDAKVLTDELNEGRNPRAYPDLVPEFKSDPMMDTLTPDVHDPMMDATNPDVPPYQYDPLD